MAEFDHSRSLKVKSNGAVIAVGLHIYDFLLMSISIQMSISHHLVLIGYRDSYTLRQRQSKKPIGV